MSVSRETFGDFIGCEKIYYPAQDPLHENRDWRVVEAARTLCALLIRHGLDPSLIKQAAYCEKPHGGQIVAVCQIALTDAGRSRLFTDWGNEILNGGGVYQQSGLVH